GVGLGVAAAMRRNRPTDHALRVLSLGGISMPTFWIGLGALYVGFYRLGWFPGAERPDAGGQPPPHVTGLSTVDALLVGRGGLLCANVLTGAVLIEKIFSWPGIGQYAYQAAVNVDVPAIAGVSLFVAFVYITVNFVVDVLYGVIDPRIRIT